MKALLDDTIKQFFMEGFFVHFLDILFEPFIKAEKTSSHLCCRVLVSNLI